MNTSISRLFSIFCFGAAAIVAFTPAVAEAQHRDYLTDEEIELVRDAQDIDDRITVLTRAIDRRFAALKVNVGAPASSSKESDKWGAMPSGTKPELLEDIKKLLQKAIDDVDNVAAHPIDYSADKDSTEKQKKRDAQRFPTAVRNLAAAANRFLPALKTLVDSTTDEKVKGLILDSIDSCEQIIEASTKVPAEPKTE